MSAANPPHSSSNTSDPRASIRSQSAGATSDKANRLAPKSLPSWIDSYEARYGAPTQDQIRAISSPPPRATPAHHNHSPDQPRRRVSKDGFVWDNLELETQGPKRTRARVRKFLLRKDAAERGRKWDHLRSAEPVIVPNYSRFDAQSPWISYTRSCQYGRLPNEQSEIVDNEILKKLQPTFDDPVDTPKLPPTNGHRTTRSELLYKRFWRLILTHPLVPLAFRLIVLLTSIIALALSVKIFQIETRERDENGDNYGNSSERTQSIVAIVVDTVAIPYIGYMTWDEYTGKPLGLRLATEKISLVLMDLFFIIFKSASTTLAFEALVYHNASDRQVGQYSQALAAFQTVGLISWSCTFTVNVFRLVQKLGGGDEGRR
ncbi:hypothetical protein QBC38DRAFT_444864 [Podospora fimiseda]|uniref:Regulator of phospholipase D SRF1 n=1 Tax=Podospora fimiseda TaxID=252190 RepID=A0AAN7BMT7_9PEZI|nr:hypothetical protein QBC38DRAFT_444864 [Podospora fimiseda]